MTPTNPSSYNSDCNCLSDRNSKKIRHREVAMIVCGGVLKGPAKDSRILYFWTTCGKDSTSSDVLRT